MPFPPPSSGSAPPPRFVELVRLAAGRFAASETKRPAPERPVPKPRVH